MKTLEKYISQFTGDLFPAFYKEEGPNFIAFVQAYYEWLETNDQALYEARRLPEYRDIDQTLDDFIVFFKTKYLNDIQFTTASNKELFIKNSLDFYRSKGTPRAVELFFKLIHGIQADVYYPGDDLFRLSDNDYRTITYLELSHSVNNVQFVGKTVTGASSGATAYAEKLIRKKVNTYFVDVLYLSNLEGNFSTGESISSSGVVHFPKILGSATTLDVVDGGSDFEVGEDVYLTSGSGRLGKARVSEIESSEGSVSFAISDGGFGYSVSPTILISDTVVQGDDTINFDQFETVTQYLANVEFDSANNNFAVGDIIDGYDANGVLILEGTVLSVNQVNGSESGDLIVNFEETSNVIAFDANDAITIEGNTTFANVTLVTDVSATGNVIASNSTNYFGMINVENTFVRNGLVIGDTSGAQTSLLTVDTGSGASFTVADITNDYTFEYSTTVISDFSAIVIDSVTYGLPGDPNANLTSNTIGAAINTTSMSIGTISEINVSNPGTDYVLDPIILIYQPEVSQYEQRDYTLTYTDVNGNFGLNEKIIGGNTAAIGQILEINQNAKTLKVRRLSIAESFVPTEEIAGDSTGTTAIIDAVSRNFSDPEAGNNAVIAASSLSVEGKIKTLDVVSSGYGYVDGESVTFEGVTDDTKTGSATLSLGQQGIGEGYYKNRKGFLSEDKYLHDNDFYQEYSYQVLTGLPFETYRDTLKKVLHVAGTKQFGGFVSTTEVDTEFTFAETSTEIV
jgi:hypothetical protein